MPASSTLRSHTASTPERTQPAVVEPAAARPSGRPALRQDGARMLACPDCSGFNLHFLGACQHCGRLLPGAQQRGLFRLWLRTFAMTASLLGLAAVVAWALGLG